MRVQPAVDAYVLARKRAGAKRGTTDNLNWALGLFAAHCGKRHLDAIGAADIERFINDDRYAPGTRRVMLSAVRGLFRWAERQKYIRRNPATFIEAPKLPRMLPRALPGGDGMKLIDACPDARARLICTLMLQQGMRCVEVSRMQLGDIDRLHNTIRIRGKADHERILPLLDETTLCLNAYLAEHPCSAGPLVRAYNARSSLAPSTISRLVSEWLVDAGVKTHARDGISAHCNRHTMATDMLLGGAHLRDVQAALGHANLQTTQVYLPAVVNGLDVAMAGRTYHGARRRP